jgi:branched-chain amino acid transport system substrate-binding protein
MKKNIIWGVVIIIIVVGIFYFTNKDEKKENDTIKIGGLFALTGKWQIGGETKANFAKIAIEEINNNGGILGKQIEFILEDDKCSGRDALSAAQKLIDRNNVKIILGPSCTPASQSVAPYANEKERLIIAFTTTADNIFDEFEYGFRMSPPATDSAIIIGKLAAKKYGRTKAAVITETTDFGKSWAENFKNSFVDHGGQIIFEEEYITGTNDFRSIISKLAVSNPDIVFLSPQAPQDAGLIIKQMKDVGIVNKFQITGNPILMTEDTLKIVETIPSSSFSVMSYAENKQLLEKYEKKYNQTPGFQFFYVASAYDAVYILKEIIESCNLNTECMRKQLIKDKYNGAVAQWSFNEFGDAVVPNESYRETRFSVGEIIYEVINI